MMSFRRASVRYGRTPEPETPFQKAAQVWDEHIGSPHRNGDRNHVLDCPKSNRRAIRQFAIDACNDMASLSARRTSSDRSFFDHPEAGPHVHGLMLIHPSLVERFEPIAGDLEATWRSIPYSPANSFAAHGF